MLVSKLRGEVAGGFTGAWGRGEGVGAGLVTVFAESRRSGLSSLVVFCPGLGVHPCQVVPRSSRVSHTLPLKRVLGVFEAAGWFLLGVLWGAATFTGG